MGCRNRGDKSVQANRHHPTIKFTAEISKTEITFLDTTVSTGEILKQDSIFVIRTHFKPTERHSEPTNAFLSQSRHEKRIY